MTPRSLRLTHAGGATESTGPGRLVCPQQHRTRALFFPHGGLGVQPRPTAVTSLPRRVPLNTNKQHLFSTISPPPFWTSLSFTFPALPTAPQPSYSPPAPPWRLSIQHAVTLLQQQTPAAISSFLTLSAFHLAPSTRSQYAIFLANFLQWLPPNFAAASDILFALQHYLLRLSSPPRPGAARSFLAAITFAAHTVLPNLVVPRSCWLTITAIVRLAPPPRRSWFPVSCLFADVHPSIFRQDASPLYGIILISYIFLLRISEACSITASDIKSGRFGIRAAKRDRTVCWRQSTAFVDTWLSHLQQTLRTIDSFDRQILTDTFRRICAVFELDCTWHSLRRGAAATLITLGTSPEQLARPRVL